MKVSVAADCWLWVWAGLFLFTSSAQAADVPRPNILFIFADDQSYKTLSCYGQSPSWVRTPQIDRLA